MRQILISCGRTGSQGSVRCRFRQGYRSFCRLERRQRGSGDGQCSRLDYVAADRGDLHCVDPAGDNQVGGGARSE
ncbi:hypothetical protein BDW68DRAFT_159914 [Aspergillus falconensis]